MASTKARINRLENRPAKITDSRPGLLVVPFAVFNEFTIPQKYNFPIFGQIEFPFIRYIKDAGYITDLLREENPDLVFDRGGEMEKQIFKNLANDVADFAEANAREHLKYNWNREALKEYATGEILVNPALLDEIMELPVQAEIKSILGWN